MKNKKISIGLVALLLVITLIPQITFASWWNPFSWGLFHKTQISVVTPTINIEPAKTPEQKINDLQKQLDALKNQQPISPSETSTSTAKIVKKTSTQKTIPVVNIPVSPTQPVKSGYQVCSDAYPNETWDGTITADNKYNCVCKTGYVWDISYGSCLLSSTTSNNTQNSIINSILHQNDAEINAQKARENSPECQTATDASNAIEQQYNSLKNRIDSLPSLSNEAQQLDYQLATLALQQSSALNKKYSACDGYIPTPPRMINTNCNITGNIANCYSQ